MAKAKSRAKKAPEKNTTPQPHIVLYGVPEDNDRSTLIRETIAMLGFPVHTIYADELSSPVGFFAGMKGFHESKAPYEDAIPNTEFMLICNLSNKQLNALLAAMRAADCSIGCKAQVTQYNRFWPFVKLIEEVSAEHAQLTQNESVPEAPTEKA